MRFSNSSNNDWKSEAGGVYFTMVFLINDSYSVEYVESKRNLIYKKLNGICRNKGITTPRDVMWKSCSFLQEINDSIGENLFDDLFIEELGVAEDI